MPEGEGAERSKAQPQAESRWRCQDLGHMDRLITMPRQRYQQNPLPLGPDAPPVELFGPEQPTPPGLQVAEQGQLGVVPLGPLFDGQSLNEGQSKD